MGAWTELVDFTFTANETSRAFTGLSITEDDFIKIVMTHVNGSASSATIRCFPNTTAGVSGFDTDSNYHNQRLTGSASTASAQRDNVNRFARAAGSQTGSSVSYFKISENGKANIFTNRTFRNDSTLTNNFDYTTSSNLTFNDPITSLTFTADQTDGLGDGSRIQIYRLDAEKVADITTTANATQVDISSLSIGKDSEYLLVSDITQGASSQNVRITPNDLTTATNYYTQFIFGNGSTAGAIRDNLPRFADVNSVLYTHIKLSEIGAYTFQSYSITEQGTTTPSVVNWFGSSTAENITSITKLNLVSSGTDGIGSDSRFQLYKLK
jgi:hypothetical protein